MKEAKDTNEGREETYDRKSLIDNRHGPANRVRRRCHSVPTNLLLPVLGFKRRHGLNGTKKQVRHGDSEFGEGNHDRQSTRVRAGLPLVTEDGSTFILDVQATF